MLFKIISIIKSFPKIWVGLQRNLQVPVSLYFFSTFRSSANVRYARSSKSMVDKYTAFKKIEKKFLDEKLDIKKSGY